MNIMITGASGFIGSHLVQRMRDDSHHLILCTHQRKIGATDSNTTIIPCDFSKDHQAEVWLDRLKDIDVVINTVGIIRERGQRTFESLHVKAPIALFEACHQAGVKRVIQISALGADEQAEAAYHLSKKQADDALRALPLQWAIIQPSLVYGEDGESSAMFHLLASLPVMLLPGGGHQQIQPVHIDDLVELIFRLINESDFTSCDIIASGPEAMTLKGYLQKLRSGLAYSPALPLPLPAWWMKLMATLGDYIPALPLSSETWGMLQRGNTGDFQPFENRIKRKLTPVNSFINAEQVAQQSRTAALSWLVPLASFSLAFLWIFSGLISISPWGYHESMRLLAAVGLSDIPAQLTLYAASGLDLFLGFMILFRRHKAWLWTLQIVVVCTYSIIITAMMPDYLLHPYTPLIKNIPLICMMALLGALERK